MDYIHSLVCWVRMWDFILGKRKSSLLWGRYELRSNRLCVICLNRPPLAAGAELGDETGP